MSLPFSKSEFLTASDVIGENVTSGIKIAVFKQKRWIYGNNHFRFINLNFRSGVTSYRKHVNSGPKMGFLNRK